MRGLLFLLLLVAPQAPAANAVSTLAGKPGVADSVDGAGSAARFTNPKGAAVDGAGNVYVSDNWCGSVRKVTQDGVVTTLAGPVGRCEFGDADRAGRAARFNAPSGVAADSAGNVYVADTENCKVRKITPAGVVTTVAGVSAGCKYGNLDVDGPVATARLSMLSGIAVDGAGAIYIASYMACTVRKIADGVVTTLAGRGNFCKDRDGAGAEAGFGNPSGVAVDAAGNVYVADETGQTIRKITRAGVVTTLAGSPGVAGSADGTGAAARFDIPSWVAVDAAGNVYATDYNNHTVRKVTQDGVATTLAGVAGHPGIADGAGSAARFHSPDGIAVDGAGAIYVADRGNVTVRVVRQ
jgi:hypothetical protein